MLNMQSLIDLQVVIFAFISLGYLLNKTKIVGVQARKSITDLVIYVVLPCNIVYSFMVDMDMDILMAGGVVLLVSMVVQVLCIWLGKKLYPHVGKEERKVLKYATICSNAGFMGSPIIEGIYGLQALFYASIYLIPLRIMMWSSGVACFTPAKGKEVLRRVITHPCIIAVMIGVVLLIFQIKLPSPLQQSVVSISGCTTFLSMIVIGGILADIDFKTVVSKVSLYYCFIRLLFIPLVVLVACALLNLPYLVIAVSTVLAGMPAGTTTAILAQKYDGDEHLAVKLIFMSTALSLFTIPLLCYLIEWIL